MRPHDDQAFQEQTLHTDSIYKGKILTLEVETVRLPNGKEAKREIVRHLGAVAVLALHDNKMLVVEQYRKALNRSIYEIPAGKLDFASEDPLQAAHRELREETGFRAGALRELYSFYTAPGFCDERIHLYLAEDLQAGVAEPDEDEFLNVMELSFEEAMQAIQEGRIQDAKTMMAVLAWSRYQGTGEW